MKEDNEKKKINSLRNNPYAAIGCSVIIILFAIILGVVSKRGQQVAATQQAEAATAQAAQEALPKKPLFESVGDIKSAFNKNIGAYEKSSKLKLKKIEQINVENDKFANQLSKEEGSHKMLQALFIAGNIDNGCIWSVGISGATTAITAKDVSAATAKKEVVATIFAQIVELMGMEFTPYVVSLIRSVDKSILDNKEAGSIYKELIKNFEGKASLSKNGYEYTLQVHAEENFTNITFSVEAVP